MMEEPPQPRQDMQQLKEDLTSETNRLASISVPSSTVSAQTQVAKMEADRAVTEAKEKEEKGRKRNKRWAPWAERMMGISAAT